MLLLPKKEGVWVGRLGRATTRAGNAVSCAA